MSNPGIPLGRTGRIALVDDEDYARVALHVWSRNGNGYAHRQLSRCGDKRELQLMHRFILQAPRGVLVDHANGDRLDNRRANLRLCTTMQNSANRTKRGNCSSRFKGVYFHREASLWHACIAKDGRTYSLKFFHSEEAAARAYDSAAVELFGEFARLNFPEAARGAQ